MAHALEQQVRERANDCCEYCHSPQACYSERFQVDHIIARQHRGSDSFENLGLSCLECNRRKGPNIASIDPDSEQLVPLFHPRKDSWSDHFSWQGAKLIGLTAIGRATLSLLEINRGPRVLVRQALIEEGVFPPSQDRTI
jgi:HNH endonuclease